MVNMWYTVSVILVSHVYEFQHLFMQGRPVKLRRTVLLSRNEVMQWSGTAD